MENKNNVSTGALIAVIALLGGLGIVFSMGVAVQSAMAPVNGYLQQILVSQKALEKKLSDVPSADLVELKTKVAGLEKEMDVLKIMVASGRPTMPQPQLPPQAAGRPMPPAEDLNKVYQLSLEGSYIFGKQDAPATIVVFNDYQCPFCSRFYPAAKEAVSAMPDKARLIIKHYPLPFHQMAKPAAKAALAAGLQGKFYEMSDLLFQNAAALSEDKFKELAGKLGLNVEQFAKDLKDKDAEFEKKIQADMELADKSDVRGTRRIFLTERKSTPANWMPGSRPLQKRWHRERSKQNIKDGRCCSFLPDRRQINSTCLFFLS